MLSSVPTAKEDAGRIQRAQSATKTVVESPYDNKSNSSAKDNALVQPLDFIGSCSSVKTLFTLPYTSNTSVSVVIHNSDGTLLLEADRQFEESILQSYDKLQESNESLSGESLKNEEHTEDVDNQQLLSIPSKVVSSETLTVLNNILKQQQSSTNSTESIEEKSGCLRNNDTAKLASDSYMDNHVVPPSGSREYLTWEFQDMKLLLGSELMVYRSDEVSANGMAVRVEELNKMKALLNAYKSKSLEGTPDVTSYADIVRSAVSQPRITQTVEHDRPVPNQDPREFESVDLTYTSLHSCVIPAFRTDIPPFITTMNEPKQSYHRSAKCNNNLPIRAVMDAYLDNIMANVPQLALCLEEKGYVQSVKLLETHSIPSSFLQEKTFNTTVPFTVIENDPSLEQAFSPEVMEMNASTLLRFLQTNCSKNNTTYLLRREAGDEKIQLYDVSSISAQHQKKWIWWLAMMSCRFAQRLKQLSVSSLDKVLKRSFRNRERNLLHNALELLEALKDLDGKQHSSLVASIYENIAESFLCTESNDDAKRPDRSDSCLYSNEMQSGAKDRSYRCLSTNSLQKAVEYLEQGINTLRCSLVRNSNDTVEDVVKTVTRNDFGVNAALMQLLGLHMKLFDVELHLVERYMKHYYSSNVMQSIRSASRYLAISDMIIRKLEGRQNEEFQDCVRYKTRMVQNLYWIWDLCGFLSSSFAMDVNWRDRGHTSGDDIIVLLTSVETSLSSYALNIVVESQIVYNKEDKLEYPSDFTNLSGLLYRNNYTDKYPCIETTAAVLNRCHILEREKRKAFVASYVAYSKALQIAMICETGVFGSESKIYEFIHKRLGNACNEISRLQLNRLRQYLMTEISQSDDNSKVVAEILCSSAEFWCSAALKHFKRYADVENEAIVRCNMCQCCKIRSNSIFCKKNSISAHDHTEKYYAEAMDHLTAAYQKLDRREARTTWDKVGNELAGTYLSLGFNRRQEVFAATLNTSKISPGQERSVCEAFEKSAKIYRDCNNYTKEAAARYQLALFYSTVWKFQRGEKMMRQKLGLSFENFNAAYEILVGRIKDNEVTFCLVSLDSSNLYALTIGERSLSFALLRCLETCNAFTPEVVESAVKANNQEWLNQVSAIAASIEEAIFKYLRDLVKVESESQSSLTIYKDLFRLALETKRELQTTSTPIESPSDKLLLLHKLFVRLKDSAKENNINSSE